MTFREKLAQEYPQWIDDKLEGGCAGCPSTFGYEDKRPCRHEAIRDCRACWDREMPLTAQEAHDLEINAEIILAYCEQYDDVLCYVCPAFEVCGRGHGTWMAGSRDPNNPASAEKQRAMLDAFEAALPPEDDAPAEAAPQEIPQAVREVVEARIKVLTEQIRAIEAERDALIDWRNAQEADREAIRNLRPADVAPVRHGSWVGEYDGYAYGEPVYDMWHCSECGWDCVGQDEEPAWNFCPNCGANMRTVQEADHGT